MKCCIAALLVQPPEKDMILDQTHGKGTHKHTCLQMGKDPSNSFYLLSQGSRKTHEIWEPLELQRGTRTLNFSHGVNLPIWQIEHSTLRVGPCMTTISSSNKQAIPFSKAGMLGLSRKDNKIIELVSRLFRTRVVTRRGDDRSLENK